MNKNIAQISYGCHRQQIKQHWSQYITKTIDQFHSRASWCDISLTLKQGIVNFGVCEKLTHDKVSKAIKDLMKGVNRRVYKNSYRRHNKRLVCVPVIETSQSDRLHIHMLVEVPSHLAQDPHRFFDIVRDEWKKSRWCYKQTEMRPLPRIENVHGWLNYILKDLSKTDETINLENLYLGKLSH